MTQAPTPGPLSVGDRVVAIADLRQTPNGSVWIKKGEEAVIVGELGVNNCLAIVLANDGNEGTWAKTCFRLAPTAPVEASGSERALQDAVDFGVGFLVDGQRVSPERVTVCHGDNSPLRPQPSGETREAVARIIDPPCWAAFDRISKTPFLDNGVAARGAHEPYLQTSLSKADAILALLSARPLALGDQHSGGDVVAAARALLDACYKADENSDLSDFVDGVLLTRLDKALSTTPAQAEAQDEGAAGEPVALAECPPGLFLWNGTLGFKSEYGAMEPIGSNFKTWKVGSRADAYCADSGEYFWGGTSNHADRDKVLVMPIDAVSAHPSPTPAADAVTKEQASQWLYEAQRTTPDAIGQAVFIANKALAALKSEGE